MAKFAKRKKRGGSRRRRRIGAAPNIDFMGLALAVGGVVASLKLQAYLSKDPTKTAMVNIAPYAGLLVGIGIPMVIKNPLVAKISFGLAVGGGVAAIKKLAPDIVGNIPLMPVISATTNRYRNRISPSVNGIGRGVGYPLPKTSVYSDAMSVVSGVGCADGSGSGGAY